MMGVTQNLRCGKTRSQLGIRKARDHGNLKSILRGMFEGLEDIKKDEEVEEKWSRRWKWCWHLHENIL